jgi:FkbM family methyltransferase
MLRAGAQRVAASFQGRLLPPHAGLSYSQDGEDMVVRSYVAGRPPGFFVDVGAHDPTRFSNTAALYAAGWSGINIDADPTLMEAFWAKRPRDINVACGVGSTEGDLELFVFNERALNTFDPEVAARLDAEAQWHIAERAVVPVRRLASILDEHLVPGQHIDLLNVDAEGRDLDVLRSNDWDRYAPSYVIAECHGSVLGTLGDDPTVAYLCECGYTPEAKTLRSVLFMHGEAAQ